MLRLSLLLALVLTCAGRPLEAFQDEPGGAVRIEINGDVTVAPPDSHTAVVVIHGNASVSGDVPVVVLVDGSLVLDSATVRYLVGVNAKIEVGAGSRITDDVRLVNSTMAVAQGAVVEPNVRTGADFASGAVIFGIVVGLGFTILVLLAGIAAAAIAPDGMREAGTAITENIGATLLTTFAVWFGLPLVAGLLVFTVIGLPTAIAIIVVVLPALWFLGYLISGIRLGDWILEKWRHSVERVHPYLAAVVGLLALLVAGWLPFIGTVVTPIAALVGSGALVHVLWRHLRSQAAAAS